MNELFSPLNVTSVPEHKSCALNCHMRLFSCLTSSVYDGLKLQCLAVSWTVEKTWMPCRHFLPLYKISRIRVVVRPEITEGFVGGATFWLHYWWPLFYTVGGRSAHCILVISELHSLHFRLYLLTFALTHARCVCVFSLQGKGVCLWFLISSAPPTPADPPPFIPCPTCKALDLWLAVSMYVCVCHCVLVVILEWKQISEVESPVGMQLHECMPCWSCVC